MRQDVIEVVHGGMDVATRGFKKECFATEWNLDLIVRLSPVLFPLVSMITCHMITWLLFATKLFATAKTTNKKPSWCGSITFNYWTADNLRDSSKAKFKCLSFRVFLQKHSWKYSCKQCFGNWVFFVISVHSS